MHSLLVNAAPDSRFMIKINMSDLKDNPTPCKICLCSEFLHEKLHRLLAPVWRLGSVSQTVIAAFFLFFFPLIHNLIVFPMMTQQAVKSCHSLTDQTTQVADLLEPRVW